MKTRGLIIKIINQEEMEDEETWDEKVQRIADEDCLNDKEPVEEREEDPYEDYVRTETEALIRNSK